jgi:post-segregation antitoxin (ccd killing protein)
MSYLYYVKKKKLLVMKTQLKNKISRKVKTAIKNFLKTHTHLAWQHLQETIK